MDSWNYLIQRGKALNSQVHSKWESERRGLITQLIKFLAGHWILREGQKL